MYNLGVGATSKIEAHEKAIRDLRARRGAPPDQRGLPVRPRSVISTSKATPRPCGHSSAPCKPTTPPQITILAALTLEKQGKLDERRAAWERYLELDGNSGWAARARSRVVRARSMDLLCMT